MKESEYVYFFLGILVIQLLIRFLKPIIGELRPVWKNTDKGIYGMPSGRAALMMFIATYLSMKTSSPQIRSILFIIVLTSIFFKYVSKEHSFLQLLIGGLLGGICGFLFSRLQIT